MRRRRSSEHVRRFHLRPDRSDTLTDQVHLPHDVRRGDLLAIPCLAPVAMEDIER